MPLDFSKLQVEEKPASEENDDFAPPKGSDKGRLLIEVYDISENQDGSELETELLDDDRETSSLFWFFEHYDVDDIPEIFGLDLTPGRWLITGIYVTWNQDYWGEVDEDWYVGGLEKTTRESLSEQAHDEKGPSE